MRKVLLNYSNLLNLYNVAEQSSNRTVGNGVQVETGNEKFTFRAHQARRRGGFEGFERTPFEDQ